MEIIRDITASSVEWLVGWCTFSCCWYLNLWTLERMFSWTGRCFLGHVKLPLSVNKTAPPQFLATVIWMWFLLFCMLNSTFVWPLLSIVATWFCYCPSEYWMITTFNMFGKYMEQLLSNCPFINLHPSSEKAPFSKKKMLCFWINPETLVLLIRWIEATISRYCETDLSQTSPDHVPRQGCRYDLRGCVKGTLHHPDSDTLHIISIILIVHTVRTQSCKNIAYLYSHLVSYIVFVLWSDSMQSC